MQLNPVYFDNFTKEMKNQDSKQIEPEILNDTLLRHCSVTRMSFLFLRITANFWPGNNDYCDVDKIWYLLVKWVNISSGILCLLFVPFALTIGEFRSSTLRTITAGVDAAVSIRVLSTLPAQYKNQRRLMKNADSLELNAIDQCANIAAAFGIVSTLTNICGTALLTHGESPMNAAVYAVEYFFTLYLAFNLFFLIMDIKVCSLLVDQLHTLADFKQLTMEKFRQVEEKINCRVRESRWASDLIILPCIACTVAIVCLVFFFMDSHTKDTVKIESSAYIAFMLKELIYVAIAFYHVAEINEKADQLCAKLCESVWGNYESLDIKDYSIEKTQLIDMHRLSVHAYCVSKPISYTLLYKRLTRVNVAVSASSFVLALLIGMIRNLIVSDV